MRREPACLRSQQWNLSIIATCDNSFVPLTTSPKDEYLRRLHALQEAEKLLQKSDRRFVTAKLVVGLLTLVFAGWLAKEHSAQIAFLFLPLLLLVALFALHERTLRKLRRCQRLQSFYGQGIARLEDQWKGKGQKGEHFLDASHPYARDLDLFGSGSLFELLCTARTRSGEDTLAQWLLTHASLEEISQRHAAVRELAPQLEFRECLALAGEDVRIGVHPDELTQWCESTERLGGHGVLRFALPLLAALWLCSIAAWFVLDWGRVALCISLINMAITYKLHARTASAMAAIERPAHDLNLLAATLKEIESGHFASPLLTRLQASLRCGDVCPSEAIRRLDQRTTWLDAHENWFVKLLDLFVFWTPQWVFAIEAWRARFGTSVRGWLNAVGEVEALASLGNYAFEHPLDTFPLFVEHGPYLHAQELAHPLLPRDRAVANDLALDENLRLIVVSGPNMAGKSTFIRCIGVNVVLALAGAPVCAGSLSLSKLQVAASIAVLDSLQGGLSRFYAEIMRLKVINELSKGPVPVLFLLDELLSGTNSHDRRVGTESFIRSLLTRNAIGLVTTHDLALAEIAKTLGSSAANFHFADTIENGKLRFDYKLTPGIVQTANALHLMRSIGLDV